MPDHYQAPDRLTVHLLNPLVGGLTRLGIGVHGSRVLEVRGRRSGEWRGTPVNLLTVDEERAYPRRWSWETRQFFGGVTADASDDELLRIAPDHPVFRLERS